MNTEKYEFNNDNNEKNKVRVEDVKTLFGLSEYLDEQQIKKILDKGYKINQELTKQDIVDLNLIEIQEKKIKEFEKAYYDIGFSNKYKLLNGKSVSILEENVVGGDDIAFDTGIDYYVEIQKSDNDIGVNIKGKEELPKEMYLFAEKVKSEIGNLDEIVINEKDNSIEIPKEVGFCKGYNTDISTQVLKDKLIIILGKPERVKETGKVNNEIAR